MMNPALVPPVVRTRTSVPAAGLTATSIRSQVTDRMFEAATSPLMKVTVVAPQANPEPVMKTWGKLFGSGSIEVITGTT